MITKQKCTKAVASGLLLVTSLVAVPALTSSTAMADSRCTTTSHTHGASFWKRTDNFSWHTVGGVVQGNIISTHDHENSDPVSCGHRH